MGQPLSASDPAIAVQRPRGSLPSAVIWGGAGLGALLVMVALSLWFHYGTTVFFDTIAAGFAGCF